MGDPESRAQDRRDEAQEAREAGIPLAYYDLLPDVLPHQQPFIDAAERGNSVEMRTGRKGPQWVEVANGRQADGKLRCGACWRDVFGTPHGESWHRVFSDGSMRCWAPESLAIVNDVTPSYVSTFIVHASTERMELLTSALDKQGQHDDE